MVEMMNIYFCHIWKTGGVSFQELLKKSFGEESCFDILPFISFNEKYKKFVHKIVYGHSLYSLEGIMDNPLIYTILREPVDRIISYWKHITRENQPTLLSFLYRKKGYKTIISHPLFIDFCCNLQTKVLGLDFNFTEFSETYKNSDLSLDDLGKVYDKILWKTVFLTPCTEEIYEKAKERLGKMSYGLFEFYEAEVTQFLNSIGVEFDSIPHINESQEQCTVFDSIEAKEMLYHANQYDVRLYDYAKKRKNL